MELARRLVVCGVFLRAVNMHLQFILTDAGDSRGRPRYLLFDVGMDAYQRIQFLVHLSLVLLIALHL